MGNLEPTNGGLDIIGDVHGQLDALVELIQRLGYEGDGRRHPEGRRLIFIGDLVDRGPNSFEVAELVRRLCEAGQALCLLGNHELNLVEWRHGRTGPKSSNHDTIEDIQTNRTRWEPVLDFFEGLPVALELSDLRVTHAVWHQGCFDALAPALSAPCPEHTLAEAWADFVRLHAAFEGGRLRDGVPQEPYEDQWEKALEVFVKGYESLAPEPFRDNDGALRDKVRTEWWKPVYSEVPRDKRIVFGHYWNMPPIPTSHDAFVPPFPSGHPELRRWFKAQHEAVAAEGRHSVPENVKAVCVDYNGVTRAGTRACVGAYRHPEAEVAWVCVGAA